jgi:molecular chaperone GrpE (heat shock protein)
MKSLQSKERRDDKKLAAEKARDRKRIKIEQRRLRIEESDAQVRRVQAETEQVRQRTSIMIDLKKAGFADDDIKTFLDGQFKTNAIVPSDVESTDSESVLDDELF